MAISKPSHRAARGSLPLSWPNTTPVGGRQVRDKGYRTAQTRDRPLQHRSFQHRNPVRHHSRHSNPAQSETRRRQQVAKRAQRIADWKAARARKSEQRRAERLAALGLTENDIDWEPFQADWNAHINQCIKWVDRSFKAYRFDAQSYGELQTYFANRKTNTPTHETALSALTLNAIKQCQLELGTDLEWVRRAKKGWGKWGDAMEEYAIEVGEDAVIKDREGLWEIGEEDLSDEEMEGLEGGEEGERPDWMKTGLTPPPEWEQRHFGFGNA